MKYLNRDSHHHRSHKTAVLSGVELRLALLTTKTADNLNKSMSDIYPDKHDALTITGQLKPSQKMRKLGDILDDESRSGPIRLKKRSRAVDKRDTFFIVKYPNLGKERRPISPLRNLRNAYHLKWLCPCVVYSRHNNLQEKLLGDLRHKLLWNVVDADMGKRPCNCPTKFKVNGVCTYGGDNSCCTSGTIYKISCLSNGCKCFYIGKSQRYVKTRIQEHIGEVTKLYAKNILITNHSQTTTPPSQTSQTQSKAQSTSSIATQEEISSLDSVDSTPPLWQPTPHH